MRHKILLIDDEETFRDSVETILSNESIDIVWAKTGASGIQTYKLSPNNFSVVVIDYLLPDYRGSDVCRHLRRINAEQSFLFTSSHFDPEFLKDQLQTGANGFVDKSAATSEMRTEILRAVSSFESERGLVDSARYEKSKAQRALEAHGMIGRSEVMFEMLQSTLAARDSKLPTLIVGETGTGKELVARNLVPKGKNLVAISGAYYANRESMMESELFGYVKGAFTDAKADTSGLVMQAHQNVLFIDEMHMLPLSAQAKLLRFFQEMKFRKVGDNSSKETQVEFKLIAAVQPDIKQRLKDGRFLVDLIERVGSLVVNVPPLRERPDDIESLVAKFQDDFNESQPADKRKQFRISTVAAMKTHSWPSNVRGLKNAVDRMLTLVKSEVINPGDFQAYLAGDLLNESSDATRKIISLAESTKDLETRSIIQALQTSRTRVEAAARVRMPLTTFMRRMSKLEINADIYLNRSLNTKWEKEL